MVFDSSDFVSTDLYNLYTATLDNISYTASDFVSTDLWQVYYGIINMAGGGGSQTLAQTLINGNNTGNASIISPDGLSGISIFDENTLNIFVNGINTAVFGRYLLIDHNNFNSLDWANRLLKNENTENTLDWDNQYLLEIGGSLSADWGAHILYGNGNINSVDWQNGYLYGTDTGYIHLAYMAMNTYDINQNISIDWDQRLLIDGNAQTTVDWNYKYLMNGGNVTIDWNNHYIYDSSNVYSIDWENRKLINNLGAIQLDWDNNILYDNIGNVVLNWAKGVITNTHNITTPATADTVNLVVNQRNLINPNGLLASLTINLPATPNNDDTVIIKFCNTVTALTVTGGTVGYNITTANIGEMITLCYDSNRAIWY